MFHNTGMPQSGKHLPAPTSSDTRMSFLPKLATITIEFISLITDTLEAKKKLQDLRPKMQEMARRCDQ
jgi:hypothetical protein